MEGTGQPLLLPALQTRDFCRFSPKFSFFLFPAPRTFKSMNALDARKIVYLYTLVKQRIENK